MITNYFIPPHPLLQPFVDNYVLCTSHDQKVTNKGIWPASNETSLIFYLADTPYHDVGEALSPLQNTRGCFVGLQSRSNGVVRFHGVYHTFIIQLKANGYNKLFRMPAKEFVNNLYDSDAVLGNAVRD